MNAMLFSDGLIKCAGLS